MARHVLSVVVTSVCLWPFSFTFCTQPDVFHSDDLDGTDGVMLLQTDVKVTQHVVASNPAAKVLGQDISVSTALNAALFIFSLGLSLAITQRSSDEKTKTIESPQAFHQRAPTRTSSRPQSHRSFPTKKDRPPPEMRLPPKKNLYDSSQLAPKPQMPKLETSEEERRDHAARMEQQRRLISMLQQDLAQEAKENQQSSELTLLSCGIASPSLNSCTDTASTCDASPASGVGNTASATGRASSNASDNAEGPNTGEQVQGHGSAAHASGACTPCAYFWQKEDGCRWADDCSFCHLCDRDAIKRRKKEKKLRLKEEVFSEVGNNIVGVPPGLSKTTEAEAQCLLGGGTPPAGMLNLRLHGLLNDEVRLRSAAKPFVPSWQHA